MNETPLSHPHLKSARFVSTIHRDWSIRTILRIETDLQTNGCDPEYLADEMDSLTKILTGYMTDHSAIVAVEISRVEC